MCMVHFCEKTFVENQFKIERVGKISEEIGKKMFNKGKIKKLGDSNLILNEKALGILVDENIKMALNVNEAEITLSDKIFTHDEEDKRVTYLHVEQFYHLITGKLLDRKEKEILCFFAHYLKGKTEENMLKPVLRDLEGLKKEIADKLDMKNVNVNHANKLNKVRKVIENKYIEHFR